MMPGNVFGRPAATETTEATDPAAGPVTGVLGENDPADVDAGRRVDLGRVLTGLRHLSAAADPARVFTDLAAVCVPALCDERVIEIVEQGGHRYRIRRPGPRPGSRRRDHRRQERPGGDRRRLARRAEVVG